MYKGENKVLNLWAILEEWVIEDGNYPSFRKNDKTNLAFYVEPYNFNITANAKQLFEQIKYAEYNFCGKIIYKYKSIIVADTGIFRFYMEINKIKNNTIGKYIQGKGKLLIDYYVWTENIDKHKNHPNIFYNLVVKKIYSIKIHEKFLKKFDGGISFPASLKNDDINVSDIIEIEGTDINFLKKVYFIIVLNEINEQIKRTFLE
jgi:hypothetical protein